MAERFIHVNLRDISARERTAIVIATLQPDAAQGPGLTLGAFSIAGRAP